MVLTLRQIIERVGSKLMIPHYQRRYVWGKERPMEHNSAYLMTKSLENSYKENQNLFLQSITLSQNQNGDWEIIDGQQRLTFLLLVLRKLDPDKRFFELDYACRHQASQWMKEPSFPAFIKSPDTEDIYYFQKSLQEIDQAKPAYTADWVLDNVKMLCIFLSAHNQALGTFELMNGTKSPMAPTDIIKAELLRMATDPNQPHATEWEHNSLRNIYSQEWESWSAWWEREDVKACFLPYNTMGLDLPIRLCLRNANEDLMIPLGHREFKDKMLELSQPHYHAAKRFHSQLRSVQRRMQDAFSNPISYNRLRAILLLQSTEQALKFLHYYLVEADINEKALEEFYKLSFLGMTIDEIREHKPVQAKFNDLLSSVSMPDVYHTEAKRDAFSLLLRLNIDEDIKLKRRFDFTIWNCRSLEHIYSKSKVWHLGQHGETLDGNDGPLHKSPRQLQQDFSFLRRDDIVNRDGVELSEHCIGNLVLLYGHNNAAFGNADFEQKKMMFLAPGDLGAFQSRNLLHSVCVFAGNEWNAQSIVENYNLTLKNLKLYYGYK